MSFTKEEQQIFQMRCINNYDNDEIASITGKNISEVKSLICVLIHKMEKKMMPNYLIALNLNMTVEELDIYKENKQQHTTSDTELLNKRICELEINCEYHKHAEQQLRRRVAQLEEQFDYRIKRMEERIKLNWEHDRYTSSNKDLYLHPDNVLEGN